MLTKKDFYEPDFYAYCCQQYEAARVYLKNCGKPLTEHDKFTIKEMKFDSVLFKSMITDL